MVIKSDQSELGGSVDQRMLVIDPDIDFEKIRGLASKIRLKILALINDTPRNVNDIAETLSLPQSTVATNLMVLEQAGLVKTEKTKGRKGTQKISSALYSEIVIEFQGARREKKSDGVIEVEMPIGLYNRFEVTAPCGLCSPEGIIGYLDVPDHFLDPNRIKAGLIWFEKGFVEYKFPNNSLYNESPISSLELATELSSEVPGTNKEWRSDITLWINDVRVGTWTSPGDYGDKRGKFTPNWWKLEGSQYGLLKHWRVTEKGSFIDGVNISSVTLKDLNLSDHHSISVRLGVEEDANRVGGINIFGRNFGNYDQDLILRLFFK
jgi:predicted transcriptional regulator